MIADDVVVAVLAVDSDAFSYQRANLFGLHSFSCRWFVGYATAAPLVAYPKASFFEDSKSRIHEKSTQKNPGETLF